MQPHASAHLYTREQRWGTDVIALLYWSQRESFCGDHIYMFKDHTLNCLWRTKCAKQFENQTETMKLALLSIHRTLSFDHCGHFWICYNFDFLLLCVSASEMCVLCSFALSVLIVSLKRVLELSSLTSFFVHLVQTGVRANGCSATVNHSQIRLHVYLSLHDTSFFRLFSFSPIRPLPAYLPLSSPLTSPLPFTSWTKSPLPFHCSCLLAIIIRAVNHHRCSAVFSPALLPNSPQSLLIVLYLHNLSTLCLSFPVYSELLWLFLYILHG